jgi:hypothetical protein
VSKNHWLLFGTCALSLFGVGQVWLVQLSSYPLWSYVGPQEFKIYHLIWWHSIWGPILGPATLVFIGALLMLRWPPAGIPTWLVWLGLALQLALILGSALWWGPLMARIEAPDGGLLPHRYQLLMTTHWLRVAIVTAYGSVACWMLARSSWDRPQNGQGVAS